MLTCRFARGSHLGHHVRVLVRHIDPDAFEALLAKRRVTKRELAQMTGLSETFIKYLANGQRNPGQSSAEAIARALRVPVRRLVTEEWVTRRRPRPGPPDPPTRGAA